MTHTNDAELLRKMMVFTRRAMAKEAGGGPDGRCRRGMMDHRGPRPPFEGGMHGGPRHPFDAPMHDGPRPHRGKGMHPRRMAFARERLLMEIAEHEEGIRQKELAKLAGTNPSSMSELIDKLETDGYVRRKVDPNDRRATLVTLTELGEARAAEISDERDAMFADAFSTLDESEKEQLNALLDKLIAGLGATCPREE